MMYIPSADIHLSGKILLPPMQKICTYILDFEADINLLVVIKKYAETSIAAEILLPLSIAERKFVQKVLPFIEHILLWLHILKCLQKASKAAAILLPPIANQIKVCTLFIKLAADFTFLADINRSAAISFPFLLKKILVSPRYYLWLHYDPWEP